MDVGPGFGRSTSSATRLPDWDKECIPLWSPDSNRIAFESYNSLTLFVRNLGGTTPDEVLVNDNERKILSDWSPQGDYIVYATLNPSTKMDLVLLPMSGDRNRIPCCILRTTNLTDGLLPTAAGLRMFQTNQERTKSTCSVFPRLARNGSCRSAVASNPCGEKTGRNYFTFRPITRSFQCPSTLLTLLTSGSPSRYSACRSIHPAPAITMLSRPMVKGS